MASSLLVTENLTVGYGRRSLFSELSVALRSGIFVCLIGANGTGKSTLLRTLAGLAKPLAGKVRLGGEDLYGLSPQQRAKRLSLVLTERVELDWMSVTELVALGRYPYTSWQGRLSQADWGIVQAAIATVGLEPLQEKSITQISDGERQKAMIARALAQQTNLMLLDEPTAYLDLPRRVETMQLLRTLAHTQNRTILMSTHDLDLALRSADQLWLITSAGNLVVGTPEELVLQGYLGETFSSDAFQFDTESGQFQLKYERRSPIICEGVGLTALWTKRALTRLGFAPVETGTDLHLKITDNPAQWQLVEGDRQWNFQSLGELTDHLQALQ
ncbi:MAG: ABC transporter ATP-binding protein [Limnothrix sp.]